MYSYLDAKLIDFTNYYNNIKTTGMGEYYVYARDLAPYNEVTGSGYYDKSYFPQYYNPSVFYASNFTIQQTSNPNLVQLSWQDNCDFEDSYNVYIKTDDMLNPSLVANAPANSSGYAVTLPDAALYNGFYAYAVPLKNGIAGSAYGPVYTEPQYYVEFYADYNYTGVKNRFTGSEIVIPDLNNFLVGSDTISSIKISGPYEVTVYRHYNFGGGSHTYRLSDPNLNDEIFGLVRVNDNITSAVIRRIPQSELNGVYLFQHANYGGVWTKITSSTPSLRGTAVGNDQTSSIKVVGPRSFVLYLCRDDNYSGTKVRCITDITNMSSTGVGNDNLSSVRIVNYLDFF